MLAGALLLAFGLQWLRKAILRSSGYKPMHDEAETFRLEREQVRSATSIPASSLFLAPGTSRQMVAGPDGLAWIGVGCQPRAYRAERDG